MDWNDLAKNFSEEELQQIKVLFKQVYGQDVTTTNISDLSLNDFNKLLYPCK